MNWKRIGVDRDGDYVFVNTMIKQIAFDLDMIDDNMPTMNAGIIEFSDIDDLIDVLSNNEVNFQND